MAYPLSVQRPQDPHVRLVRDARWHPTCCNPDPAIQLRLRAMNGVLVGFDTVSGEELIFRTRHVKAPRNVQNGPTLRPVGIKYQAPVNTAEERLYFKLLDEINDLKVTLATLEA